MGQGEVISLLKANPEKWFTVADIRVVVGNTSDTINRIMRTMRRYEEVDYMFFPQYKGGRKMYHYRWKK